MNQFRPPQLIVACRHDTLASSIVRSPCGSRPRVYDLDGSSVQVLPFNSSTSSGTPRPTSCPPSYPHHREPRDAEHRGELFQEQSPIRKSSGVKTLPRPASLRCRHEKLRTGAACFDECRQTTDKRAEPWH